MNKVIGNQPFLKVTVKPLKGQTILNADLYAWTAACLRRVSPRGYICLISDAGRTAEIISALFTGGAGGTEIIPLIGGDKGKAERVLICGRLGVKTLSTVHSPVFMNNKSVLMDGLTISELSGKLTPKC